MMQEKLVAGIKVNGKVMREFQGTVYVPFGTDYSIFFKNLNSQKVQIDIEIDGEDILDGNSLLLEPNMDLDLNRWLVGGLTNGPRLKFIEKTEGIRERVGESLMDGIVKITYQFERVYEPTMFLGFPRQTYYSSPNFTPTFEPFYTTSNITCSASEPVQCSALKNEDGMTVKGEELHQQFQEGSIGILDGAVHVICFNLKGNVNQNLLKDPITVKSKIKCSKCLKWNKAYYKFCTDCGNKLWRWPQN